MACFGSTLRQFQMCPQNSVPNVTKFRMNRDPVDLQKSVTIFAWPLETPGSTTTGRTTTGLTTSDPIDNWPNGQPF